MKGLIRAAALAAVACLALTACGNSSNSTAAADSGSPAAAPSSTASTSLSAFQTCLKQHGVTVKAGGFGTRPSSTASPRPHPTGSFPAGGFGNGRGKVSAADSAAYKACAKYAPAGFTGGFGRGFTGISASALAAFKSCMTQNGVKVTGTTAEEIMSSLRKSTGKAATAFKTCRVLIETSTPTPSASS